MTDFFAFRRASLKKAGPLKHNARTSKGFLASVFLLVLLLSACSIHKLDIQQGNVITQETFEKLKLGMDKKRVQYILGTPLVQDPFHRDRWDYVYIFKSGDTNERQSASLTLYFEGEQLHKIDVHSALPKEAEVKKPGQSLRRESKTP